MIKLIKIKLLVVSFIFLTGFVPFAALIGPASTIISTGNVYKAGVQVLIDHSIQKKTGKNSFMLVKSEIDKQNSNRQLNNKLKILVKKRIEIARQKIKLQKISQ